MMFSLHKIEKDSFIWEMSDRRLLKWPKLLADFGWLG